MIIMRSKIITYLLLSCITATTVQAQQIFKISQFVQHNFLYNPAAAGASDRASVGSVVRTMWADMEGGPKTFIAYGDKFFDKQKVGVSAVVYSDKTGPTLRNGGNLNLSYAVKVGENRRVQFGLGAHLLQFRIDHAKIASAIPNDPLLAAPATSFKGDANAGVYYKSPTLNVGISAMQLIQPKLNIIKGTNGEDNSGKLYRHYFFTANYNYRVDEETVLTPNFLFKYLPNAPLEFEGGVQLMYKDFIWVGGNYHYQQEYSIFAGIMIENQFSIGYSYDRYNTPADLFTGGNAGHELTLRYFFNKK